MKTKLSVRIDVMTAVFVSASVITGSVAAQMITGEEPRGPVSFETFDQDGDGRISPEEFDTMRTYRHAARAQAGLPLRKADQFHTFRSIDLDGNGGIDRREFATHQSTIPRHMPGR
jgi:Ca2+-binding EF-hand superfamily protein